MTSRITSLLDSNVQFKKKKQTHNACKETQIHGPFKEVKKSTEIVLETDLITNQLKQLP